MKMIYGKLITVIIMFQISGITGCRVRPNSNTPNEGKPSNLNWAWTARRALDRAIDASRERDRLLVILKTSGYPALPTNEQFIDWAQHASPRTMETYESFVKASSHVVSRMIEVWFETGYPADLPNIPSVSIPVHAQTTIDLYAKWLDEHEHSTFQATLDESLTADIDAIRSEYCFIAVHVLQKFVRFDPPLQSDHPTALMPPSDENRKDIYEAFNNWYLLHAHELRWNSSDRCFTGSCGEGFKQPFSLS